jgi:uncharacterized protein (TIGR00251 family)
VSEPAWLSTDADGGAVLRLHVQPNAKRSEFAGEHGDALKLRLAAPPVDGKANAALCTFLAEFCSLPKSSVALVSGDSSRTKRVRLAVFSAQTRARLLALVK